MGTRELIILILGLAVVAVMLRGLYLALQARRGQLRLAIDKNIPKDVDLNALEMAELPNGGARVVGQSLEMVNRQNRRAEKAAVLDLGGNAAKVGPIPVLMDTVALGEVRIHAMPARAALEDDEFEDDFEDDIDDDDEELEDEFEDDEDFDEDPDKDLVEIEEEEDLDTFEEEDEFDDEEDDELDDEELDEEDDFDPDSEEEDEDEFEEIDEEEDEDFLDQPGADELVDDDDEYTVNVAGRSEPVIKDIGEIDGEFEKEFGSISMTAGERIGASTLSPTAPTPSIEANLKASARAEQASLFNDDDQPEPAPKRASLLERFGERARSRSGKSGKSEQPEKAPKMQKRREAKPAPTQDMRSVREAREQKEVRPIEPSEVLVINVMAREGEVFHGDDLLQVLITSGLKFGEMSIFHHRLNNVSNGAVIFSVANILNPGTFDLNRMGEFNTRGISMFLSMPAFINNLEAFELMLKTAQQIRGAMNGELKDDHRNVMTAQTIEHYRQRVRDYELRRLKAAQA